MLSFILFLFLGPVCGRIDIRGMTFTGDRYCPEVAMDSDASFASLRHLASTGCNFVSLVVTWYQTSYMSAQIFPLSRALAVHDPKGTFWNYTYVSETPRAVVAAIRLAHRLGMKVFDFFSKKNQTTDKRGKVMLKPHIDLINSQGLWRGDIIAVSGWWEAYTKMMMMWARISQKENVEMLCVSTELVGEPVAILSTFSLMMFLPSIVTRRTKLASFDRFDSRCV
jgi:hypothetical protein